MLAELKTVSQPAGQPGTRRWFADEEMDLIVWYTPDGNLDGFQLCYDKGGNERALTWKAGGSVVHCAVDQGEDLPTDNRTPIMAPDGRPSVGRVLEEFEERGAELPTDLRTLVAEKIRTVSVF
ncbi:MAG: hypothetical protein HY928_17860 [Elusimicrobia bacterium]|nr:hypothetical protein [Elusimicrobiota bacterium]